MHPRTSKTGSGTPRRRRRLFQSDDGKSDVEVMVGNDSLVRQADGSLIVPANELEWEEWVSASSTRNFLLNDPLVDWLDRYGAARGFVRDDHLAGYDPRSD